jgi:deoxyadenosine/deoxycytidine kinase
MSVVSLEGNIASGKSTLLEKLREIYKNYPNILFVKEPVDEWEKVKDENGVTMLEKFYENQEKYSFPFQMMAYVSRIKEFRNTINEIKNLLLTNQVKNNHFIIITERSLYTDKMVFAKMLYDNKKIEPINYQVYLNWFDTFSSEFKVNKIIYIKTLPIICNERIKKRSRDGECSISLDYLESCDNYHEDMLDIIHKESICKTQLILDGNVDLFENIKELEVWIQKINHFIL